MVDVALYPIGLSLSDGLRELWSDYGKGGVTMHFIVLLSVFAIAFTIERAIRLRRSRVIGVGLERRVRELWARGEHDAIIAECEAQDTALARAVRAIVTHRAGGFVDAKTIGEDTASIELRVHYRRLLPLTVAATIAPLLGLFGTVAGMIGAFNAFYTLAEMGNPKNFAGDISKALITTAFGLIVAMPSLAAFHYFKSRTNALADELEAIISELCVEWFVRDQNPRVPTRAAAGSV